MTLYKHLPLPEGCIRLATIQPGNLQDEMVVSMSVKAFNKDTEYEALSYAWGSGTNRKSLHIKANGRQSFTLSITRNLAIALQHLRRSDAPRVVWVDAICINQSDAPEKSRQVKKMCEIYRMARRVVAFLGPEEDDSNHGMTFIRRIASQVEIDWNHNVMKPADGADDTTFGDDSNTSPLMSRDMDAIYHILCRTWFSRLWIRQEIFLASAESLIQCGSEETEWPVFRRALACLEIKPYFDFEHSDLFVARMKLLGGLIWQPDRVSFLNLHDTFDNASCSDPRDRLFAVQALLAPVERDLCPTPDYNKPWVETYKDLVLSHVKKFSSLRILRECHYDPAASTPSWVPDWSNPTTARSLSNCPLMASSQLDAHYEVPRDGVLRVAGVISTTISDLQAIPDLAGTSRVEMYEVYRQILTNRGIDQQKSLSDDLLEAYARTFVCGCLADGFDPDRALMSLEAAKDVVALVNDCAQYDSDDFEEESEEEKFFSSSMIIGGFQFARCDDRYFGIVPSATQVGDKICVLMGCDSPMVLRRTATDEFLLIGEAYFHGLCEGEAFLGPHDDSVRVVRVFPDGHSKFKFGFLDMPSDTDTPSDKDILPDKVSFEDPRLKKLPIDLSAFREKLNEDSKYSLRVDPEILMDIGVNITYFDLV